eukprot:6593400-Prymnesium_polylepis.1
MVALRLGAHHPPGASPSKLVLVFLMRTHFGRVALHVLSQFGYPSGHGERPEREFCAPNVQAYAAG